MPTKAGVKVTVGGETKELEEGKVTLVDFCQQATLEAAALTPVLFAQAWHPEFAAIERTTELRIRSKAFGLSEDELKEVTKVVNDNAKKSFDKGAKHWRTNSALVASFADASKAEADAAKAKEDAA